jgi:gamma-glutamylcyclotransferase (GGCT)/AIG2-like uncharacterized protein YtfP
MVPIFVYGTLRRDEAAHRLLAHTSIRWAPALLPCARLHSTGAYPIAVQLLPTECDVLDVIHGEVHWLAAAASPAVLTQLDQYEGDEYVRALCTVTLLEPQITQDVPTVVEAWVYLGEPDYAAQFPVIASGDWRKRA